MKTECQCGDQCPTCENCDCPLCECFCDLMKEEKYLDDEDNLEDYDEY